MLLFFANEDFRRGIWKYFWRAPELIFVLFLSHYFLENWIFLKRCFYYKIFRDSIPKLRLLPTSIWYKLGNTQAAIDGGAAKSPLTFWFLPTENFQNVRPFKSHFKRMSPANNLLSYVNPSNPKIRIFSMVSPVWTMFCVIKWLLGKCYLWRYVLRPLW